MNDEDDVDDHDDEEDRICGYTAKQSINIYDNKYGATRESLNIAIVAFYSHHHYNDA
jgi:hypothetical protein